MTTAEDRTVASTISGPNGSKTDLGGLSATRTDQGAAPDQGGDSPLLSVTITNYNYARFLPRAIESILAQSFNDFELIIIDNASTDGSANLIEQYAVRDHRIRAVFHKENVGLVESLRESCDLARGRYRVHVDADDWVMSNNAFEKQIRVLEAHQQLSFVYSSLALFGPNERKLFVSHPFSGDVVLPGELALESVLGFNLNHSGMMLRLESYKSSGGYTAGFMMCLDMLLAAKLCDFGGVGYIDDELYAFRQHGSNDHLAFRPRGVREEILPVIDVAFAGSVSRRLDNPEAVRRRVLRRALVHVPTQNIFAGHIRLGWRMYWESARVRPLDTVLQRRTIALLARTLLGGTGYAALRGTVRAALGFGRN
jgi:glycosyltransferase involved in cell wall biosynthesis